MFYYLSSKFLHFKNEIDFIIYIIYKYFNMSSKYIFHNQPFNTKEEIQTYIKMKMKNITLSEQCNVFIINLEDELFEFLYEILLLHNDPKIYMSKRKDNIDYFFTILNDYKKSILKVKYKNSSIFTLTTGYVNLTKKPDKFKALYKLNKSTKA